MAELREFLKYYQAYKQKIFNYLLYRLSFDRDTAEDLTSEVFIKAYEHFDSYDETKPFQAWIYTIAHHHFISYLRQKKQTSPIEEAEHKTIPHTFVDSIDTQLTMQKVMAQMQKLPELEQTILDLRMREGLSHAEIAEIVGKKEVTVRVILSRALGTLRGNLTGLAILFIFFYGTSN